MEVYISCFEFFDVTVVFHGCLSSKTSLDWPTTKQFAITAGYDLHGRDSR
jgi:hypothetical protein